ncbi:antichymotrypsin-2-like isoform X6 [Anticarsia gemmatalis]|uniref:antichymotrypsin-2-like isoform X6 n=1 Tax=Anticarsia gemmatalis TaxID=129554 RepID=UPI003F76706C
MKLILCILVFTAAVLADTNVDKILKEGNDHFTANLFQEVVKKEAGKSVVLSAFSVLTPLSQLAVASVGDSHDEILSAIGMPNDEVTKNAISSINTRLSSVRGVELKQANKVFIRNGYTLNDEFAEVSKNVFHSEVQNLNLTDNVGSARQINQWVEEHTNRRIKDLVDPKIITPLTVSLLVNAIYFNGRWKTPFSNRWTDERDFFVTKENTISIPMMHQTDEFKYGSSSELNARFLEMMYAGDETSFVVVLPDEVDGVDALIKKLEDPAALTRGLQTMSYQNVVVQLPKFKIETTTDLKKVLQNMNVTKLFAPGQARLDNLLRGESDLYVSDAIQKAFIDVNEEGSEAAAANVFSDILTSDIIDMREPVHFIANHPFVFYVMQNNIILFNGVYRS